MAAVCAGQEWGVGSVSAGAPGACGAVAHLGLEVTWAKCGGGGVLKVVVVELLLAPGVDRVLA